MTPPSNITVITPTYNRANFLKKTLESIRNQNHKPYQLIVVDDGSVDCTEHVVRSTPFHIDYIKKENGGKSSAINVAMKIAKGDAILVFDDDDVLDPTALSKHIQAFEKNPTAHFTYSQNLVGSTNKDNEIEITGIDCLDGIDHDNLFASTLVRCQTLMQGMLIRRSAFDAIIPFNEYLIRSQDYEFMLRLMLNFKGQFINEPTFTLREHEGTRGAKDNNFPSKIKLKKWLEYDRIILKNMFEIIKKREPILTSSQQPGSEKKITLMFFCAYAGRALWNEAIYFLQKYLLTKPGKINNDEKKLIHKSIRKSTLEWINSSPQEKFYFLKTLSAIPYPIQKELIRGLTWQSGGKINLINMFIFDKQDIY